MAVFTFLEAPDGRPERVGVVPEGFSVRAAAFTVFWALWHRMWVVAAVLFAISVLFGMAGSLFRPDAMFVLASGLATSLIFGFEARALQVESLRRAGYRVSGLVTADSLEAAELQYFANRPVQTAKEPAPAHHPAPLSRIDSHDALGLFGSR
jgi:hypothetical protein